MQYTEMVNQGVGATTVFSDCAFHQPYWFSMVEQGRSHRDIQRVSKMYFTHTFYLCSFHICSPEWYEKLLQEDLKTKSSKPQTDEKQNCNPLPSLQCEYQDEYVEDESTELSTSAETDLPTAPNELENTNIHSKWNSKNLTRTKLSAVRTLIKSAPQFRNQSSIEEQTLPLVGFITARSPPPNLELPLIPASFRLSAFSSIHRDKERVCIYVPHKTPVRVCNRTCMKQVERQRDAQNHSAKELCRACIYVRRENRCRFCVVNRAASATFKGF